MLHDFARSDCLVDKAGLLLWLSRVNDDATSKFLSLPKL